MTAIPASPGGIPNPVEKIKRDFINAVAPDQPNFDTSSIAVAFDLMSSHVKDASHGLAMARTIVDWGHDPRIDWTHNPIIIAAALADRLKMPFTQMERFLPPEVISLVKAKRFLQSQLCGENCTDKEKEYLIKSLTSSTMLTSLDPFILMAADSMQTLIEGQENESGNGAELAMESKRVFDVLAPLLKSANLTDISQEIEDAAFFHTQPDEYLKMEEILGKDRYIILEEIKTCCAEVSAILNNNNIPHRIEHPRIKSLKGGNDKLLKGETITDQFKVRIIVDKKGKAAVRACVKADDLCKSVLLNKSGWQFDRDRHDNFFGPNQKPNGYQAIHAGYNRGKQKLNLQIRTESSHWVAEFGSASHEFDYKGTIKFGPEFKRRVAEKKVSNPAQLFSTMREHILDGGQIYVQDSNRRICKLMPRPGRKITAIDFAASQGEATLARFPDKIRITRYDPFLGRLESAQINVTAEIMNGDTIQYAPTKEPRKPDTLTNWKASAGSLFGQAMLAKKIRGRPLSPERQAELTKIGELLFNCQLETIKKEIIAKIQLHKPEQIKHLLKRFNVLFSKKRIAKQFNFDTIDDLYAILALLREENSPSDELRSLLIRNCVFISYSPDKMVFILFAKSLQGIEEKFISICQEHKIESSPSITFVRMRALGKYILIDASLSYKGKRFPFESFCESLKDLYLDLENPIKTHRRRKRNHKKYPINLA